LIDNLDAALCVYRGDAKSCTLIERHSVDQGVIVSAHGLGYITRLIVVCGGQLCEIDGTAIALCEDNMKSQE